uniref:TLDc domain-containing protein n=1 Tax=Paramormyrops kingsleyae TaxID=1676925 RepID=A0A3B3RNW7_9TELE
MTFNSRLDPETEKKLLKLFDLNVNFRLLYKGSHFNFDIRKLFQICSDQGSFILTVYFGKHIFGGFLKKSLPRSNEQVKDEDAFVFSLYDSDSTATRFSVNEGHHAFHRTYSSISFGDCLKVAASDREFHVNLCSTYDFNWPEWDWEKQLCEEVELHRVQGRSPANLKKGGQPIALTLCDVRDMGDSEETGLSLHDALAVINGHAPEGYKVCQPFCGMPINPSSAGYCLDPGLQDKIHCVVFVLNARSLHSYGESLVKMIKKYRREISDLGEYFLVIAAQFYLHMVTFLHLLQVQEAASLADVPVSFVLPVKNYMSELTVNRDTDILIFSAVRQILHAIDDTFEEERGEKGQEGG